MLFLLKQIKYGSNKERMWSQMIVLRQFSIKKMKTSTLKYLFIGGGGGVFSTICAMSDLDDWWIF